jgi:pimeloyl-ACP methyl ester carboxylesterase
MADRRSPPKPTLPAPVRPRSARVGAGLVRWHAAGQGPPLVLVHGLAGSWRWWERALPDLARQHECHMLDLPRFGAALHPDDTAEWIAGWLEAVGLGAGCLVGHSLGGAAAASLVAHRPGAVDALVLVAPVGVPTGRRPAGYALPLLTALATSRPRFARRLGTDLLRAGPASLLRGALYAVRADVRERARDVHLPTLLVWGERDPLVPAELAEEWRRAIPHARLVLIPRTGHVPMLERPQAFAAALEEFLDDARDLRGRGPVRHVRLPGDHPQAPVGEQPRDALRPFLGDDGVAAAPHHERRVP